MTPVRPGSPALDKVADLLHDVIGLRAESSVRTRLHRCIREGAASRGLDLEDYLARVARRGATFDSLLNELTVQESAFFRHPEHFEVLARDLLPTFRRPVQIWSAACANGQEAFSLAMVLVEQGVEGTVLATDLSTAALEATSAGCYTSRQIGGLSAQRIERHMVRTPAGWQMNKALRDRITTSRHNLVDPIPGIARASQVIFCRNVLIYISAGHTRAFLDRLADTFPTGTPLFLGAAESLWQVTDRIEPVRIDDTFIYRLHRTAPPRPSAPQGPSTPTGAGAPRGANGTAPPGGPRPSLDLADVRPGHAVVPRLRPHVLNVVDLEPRTVIDAARSIPSPGETNSDAATTFARAGQAAIAVGDHRAAVAAFRACAFLIPDDAIAQLHLALALEAAGDQAAARRAFGVARRALSATDPALFETASDGYSFAEVVRLVDAKEQVMSR